MSSLSTQISLDKLLNQMSSTQKLFRLLRKLGIKAQFEGNHMRALRIFAEKYAVIPSDKT